MWKKLFFRLSYRMNVSGNFLVFIRPRNICSMICWSVKMFYFYVSWAEVKQASIRFILYMWYSRAKGISRIRDELMVERPCISCLASSEHFVTLELTEKHHNTDTVRGRAEHSTILEKVDKMKKKWQASARRRDTFRSVQLLSTLSLSSVPSFIDSTGNMQNLLWKDVYSMLPWYHCTIISGNIKAPEKLLVNYLSSGSLLAGPWQKVCYRKQCSLQQKAILRACNAFLLSREEKFQVTRLRVGYSNK